MKRTLTLLFSTGLMAVLAFTANGQTNEFNYQGNLANGGSPAGGNYDFEFVLYDSLNGGTQVGPTLSRTLMVTNGNFAVKLDFGPVYPGADRYLEIHVRPAGQGGFVVLSPRQLINATPYAVKSLNADTATNATNAVNATNATTATTAATATNATNAVNAAQLGGVAANQYVLTGDARLSDARPPTAGSGNYVQNQNAGPQASSNFNISGNGSAGGTLSANILNATTQFNLGGNRILAGDSGNSTYAGIDAGSPNSTGTWNAFFGTGAGFSNTTGGSNTFLGNFAGNLNTIGGYNSFFGQGAGKSNTEGVNNSFVGRNAGLSNTTGNNNTVIGGGANLANGLNNATALGAFSQVDASNSLVLGSVNGVNGATADTNVGIGTTAPTARLHVVGDGLFTGNLTVNGTLIGALPAGSSNYIQNGSTQQASSNFNISGTGNAGVFNAASQFNIAGSRVLSNPGQNNLFAGVGTGAANTTGNNNAFFGTSSGPSNTTGTYNAFFGGSSGFFNTTGSSNSFFGEGSGLANTEGNLNTFLGMQSGYRTTTGGGNAFFGGFSGSNNASGSNNTAVGTNSDLLAGNLTNATAIGYRAAAAESNSMVLGSINGVNGALSNTSVGIGTTTPGSAAGENARFAILQQQQNQWSARIRTSGIGAGSFGLLIDAGTNSGDRAFRVRSQVGADLFSILGNGKVGIGTDTPGTTLQVNGDVTGGTGFFNVVRTSLLQLTALDATGPGSTLCAIGPLPIVNVGLCSSSSLRYKKNISTFHAGLNVINRLRPISFDWKSDGSRDFGLAAEDVEKVDPRLVVYREGRVEGVRYERLPVVLINAVKEQQAQIDTQRELIAGQNEVNKRLQAQIDVLKKLVCSKHKRTAVCR